MTLGEVELDPDDLGFAGDGLYVVALRTFGSFHGFCTDPVTLEEALAFITDPPDLYRPRPQDNLVIYELREVPREP